MRLGAIAALASLALAACKTLPTVGTDGLSYDARRERLATVSAWESRGRLAVDTGERGYQGRFQWLQDGDTLELTVRAAPVGSVLQVRGTPEALTVTARGDTRVLTDPEAELSELLGWWLPVGSLHAWLLALPDPGFPADTQLGREGTLAALEQRLWRIDYVSYQLGALPGQTGAGLLVPRRIDLAHGNLRVRLTIDDWHPTAAP